jgi:hypothetical protein
MGRIQASLGARLLTIGFGIDRVQQVDAPLMLEPRRLARVNHAAQDGDYLASEEVQIGFPVGAVHGQGAVATHAPTRLDGESFSEHGFVEGVDGLRRFLVDGGRCFAEQAAVGRAVIVLVDESPEPDIEVMQGAERAYEIEATFAQCAPETLHFPACRGIVGLGVDERRAHACASQAQCLTAVS